MGILQNKKDKPTSKRSGAKTAKAGTCIGAKKGTYRLLKEREMLSKLDQSKSLRKLKRKKTLGTERDARDKEDNTALG